ncbi:membrane traffic protein [Lithospermum erythrorhizon]|uniref:Membrane traffic protein n=1 Tax=Lithospermum erythrorhizon TaxID=34254 RepID=A0AAV3QYV1_LITER
MTTPNSLNLHHFTYVVFIVTILHLVVSMYASCEVSFKANNKLYDYNLDTPIAHFPHGVQSEDGFYKVVANETVLWFQLCDEMIFNHDPPSCVDCKDCGGSSRCGMGCTALVAQKIGGYPVCTAIGLSSSTVTELIDVNHPKIGITVTMSNSAPTQNCSVKVSIICDSKRFQAPQTIQKIGACDYVSGLNF